MKNIFIKSILRQPLRTMLLILLIAVTSFSFVMRGAEYIIINERVNEVSGFFRAVGQLNYTGSSWYHADVGQAAEVVSESSYVAFSDRRRTVEAILMDMPNTNVDGQWIRMVGRLGLTPLDAFFYGTLIDIRHADDYPYIVLYVEVDSVLRGHPETIQVGQTLAVHYFMDSTEMQTGQTAIDGMQIGERYFLRGVHYGRWEARESEWPFNFFDRFVMHPISEVTYDALFRSFPRAGVWYVTANHGEDVDLAIPGLERLAMELHWVSFAQSKVRLQTTVDMSYMPIMQEQSRPRGRLTEGRLITLEDNEQSRSVAVVHEVFARRRGLSIGDTLTIGIPPAQRRIGSTASSDYVNLGVMGEVHAPLAHTLELEIVGLFDFTGISYSLATPWATTFIYMPDSVLPPDVTIRSGRNYDHISFLWHSFVLNDPRDADAFLLENRDTLAGLGYTVEFLPGVDGAREFWESARQILQSVRFNMIVFSVLAILVLMLTNFLYLRQRQKDFAILRALGNPAGKTNRQLLAALFLIALPAVIIGGIGGWHAALNEAANVLNPLGDAVGPLATEVSISILWLIALMVAVLAGLIVLTLLVSLKITQRPILELLQESTSAKVAYGRQMSNTAPSPIQSNTTLPNTETTSRKAPNIKYVHNNYQLSFIFRHILRQRAKSILAVIVALFFVLALGFLQTTIDRIQREIDNLYYTTIVTGEIRQADPLDFAHGRFFNNVIAPQTIENVAPLVRNMYIEACHEFAVLVLADEGGALPGNWYEVANINLDLTPLQNFERFDPYLIGINDVERFVEINSARAVNHSPRFTWLPNDEVSWVTDWEYYDVNALVGLKINFAEGFYPGSFEFMEGSPIPIIISNRIMGLRGWSHGDIIYVGTITTRHSSTWNHSQAVIVGTHNRNISSIAFAGGAVMPLEALEYVVGDELRYISIRFEIDPAFNREISYIQAEITEIVRRWGAGETPLSLILNDEILRMVVAPMEQNLSLLRLLYPVAIALSVIIGLGLSMLLMLQTAKIAAIMRVLGASRKKSRITLCIEQMVICLIGLIIGIIILTIAGWGFGFASSLLLAGLYFAGALTGTVCGAIFVTNRPPLELLQVKE